VAALARDVPPVPVRPLAAATSHDGRSCKTAGWLTVAAVAVIVELFNRRVTFFSFKKKSLHVRVF